MATAIKQINLKNGQRAERKLLITLVEWDEQLEGTTGTEQVREIQGVRVEDSAIEYNPDIQESTDILGNNYTDVNKTQPSQSMDPNTIIGGGRLSAYLNDIRRRNALSELQGFTVYIITAFIGNEADGYEAEKHALSLTTASAEVQTWISLTRFTSQTKSLPELLTNFHLISHSHLTLASKHS